MANYSASDLRSGSKILIDGDPCAVVDNEFVKPGKGQAFNRIRIRNLRTGRVVEKTFRNSDSIESADVVDCPMQFLYAWEEFVVEPEPGHRVGKRRFELVPNRIAADPVFRACRELDAHLLESEFTINVEDQPHDFGTFGRHLLRRTEDMRVVLRKVAHPQ